MRTLLATLSFMSLFAGCGPAPTVEESRQGLMLGVQDPAPAPTEAAPDTTARDDQNDVGCYRTGTPPLGYGNLEGFIIDCFNAGGKPTCVGGEPMCCKAQAGGGRECTQSPGDLSKVIDWPQPAPPTPSLPVLGSKLGAI